MVVVVVVVVFSMVGHPFVDVVVFVNAMMMIQTSNRYTANEECRRANVKKKRETQKEGNKINDISKMEKNGAEKKKYLYIIYINFV